MSVAVIIGKDPLAAGGPLLQHRHQSAVIDHRRRPAWKWTKRLPSMITAVVGRLREEWSPQQTSGFIEPLAGVGVSRQWIYSLIRDHTNTH